VNISAGARLRRRLALVATVAGSIGSGCEVVAGLDEDVRLGPAGAGGASTGTTVPSGGGAPTSSSGSSAGGVGDGGDGAGAGGGGEGGALDCANVGYPLPPSAEDEGGLIEVILAVRSIALDGSGGPDLKPEVEARVGRLFRWHIDPAPTGLWIDRIDERGRSLATDVPASIFYHLVSALTQYLDGTEGSPQ